MPRRHKTVARRHRESAYAGAAYRAQSPPAPIRSRAHEHTTKSETGHDQEVRQPAALQTGTSTYVTLEDLAAMVKTGEDFVVYDAKTGEDITRSVLAQIIFEQENKEGGRTCCRSISCASSSASTATSMQMLVPRYLEASIDSLTREQQKFREQMAQAFGGQRRSARSRRQVRRNMEMFERAFAMFTPFARARRGQAPAGRAEQAGAVERRERSRRAQAAARTRCRRRSTSSSDEREVGALLCAPRRLRGRRIAPRPRPLQRGAADQSRPAGSRSPSPRASRRLPRPAPIRRRS